MAGTWASTAELDFYENGGLRTYNVCAHEWSYGKDVNQSCKFGIRPLFQPTAYWHRYGARVANNTVTYKLDGVTVATHALSSRFNQSGWFLFNLWPNNHATNQWGYPATLKVARIVVTSG